MPKPKKTREDRLAYNKLWYAKNREKSLAVSRAYRAEHAEELRQYNRTHRLTEEAVEKRKARSAKPEVITRRRELQKKRRDRLGDSARQTQREYFASHRQAVLKKNREWYARNKSAVLKSKREYFQNNYSRLYPQRRKWVLENRAKVRQYIRIADWKRRVWSQANGGECTLDQAMLRVEYFEWECRYCHKELTIKTLTLDHQIPLARKGTNWPSNLVPCCKRCNSRKSKKTRIEFLAHLERYGT